jgi:membrane associated rhomboid family serine protease
MMYQQQPNNLLDAARDFFSKKSVLPRLIMINGAVFVLVYFVKLFAWFFQVQPTDFLSPMARWLAVPSAIESLVVKPWTLLTYMFLHEGFFHLFFNMIILYFGGTIFLQYLSQRKLLSTYILGGFAGALVYILAYNLFPVFEQSKGLAVALGASASVLAIMVAIAAYVPQYTVNLFLFGKVKLKYVAIAFIMIDIFSIIGNNPGGHLAHLGGAFWGFLYIYLYKRKFDIYQIFNGFYRPKMRLRHKSTSFSEKPGRPLTDDEYNEQKLATQKEVDQILDKIAASGYSSLTKREKDMLFKMSNGNKR